MTPIDPLVVAVEVAAILDRLNIRYVIGGSVASSVLGEPRSTLDLDVMIDASSEDIRRLAEDLIIRKLLWFRKGGESAARQWRDVVSILKSSPVDSEQLLGAARDQDVEDLLSRAMRDAFD